MSLNFDLTLDPLTVRCQLFHTREPDCAQPTSTPEHLTAYVMPYLQCPRDHVTLFRCPPTGLESVVIESVWVPRSPAHPFCCEL